MEPLGPEAERYLRAVVEGQPIWVRGELREELRGHLVDSIARRTAQGVDLASAQRQALESLGPAEVLRHGLAGIKRPARLSSGAFGGLLDWVLHLPLDWFAAPIRALQGRPVGSFQRDYALGRYDAIIARREIELTRNGSRFNLHHELGVAYSAIGDLDRSLEHLRAEVAQLQFHPLPRLLGRGMALATAYSNVAGVLERLDRLDEADAVIAAGLVADPRHGMLHLQRARRRAAVQNQEDALRDLEAFLEDGRMRPHAQVLLLLAQDPSFEPLRQDAQFQRLMLRAATS
jgi:tetratricopeptide (TPR) repeat protein